MTDLFEEMGFDAPPSRWDAERADDFEPPEEVEDFDPLEYLDDVAPDDEPW